MFPRRDTKLPELKKRNHIHFEKLDISEYRYLILIYLRFQLQRGQNCILSKNNHHKSIVSIYSLNQLQQWHKFFWKWVKSILLWYSYIKMCMYVLCLWNILMPVYLYFVQKMSLFHAPLLKQIITLQKSNISISIDIFIKTHQFVCIKQI